ncbi:MAG: 2,4-dihydroxyhept-2-ene-1,7-dioic acid aldolase [Thermomicrobiales bacterium]|nr:2,4-dihydroxyhept-2-ene-1,7-dioic acid aldolase [Thermomicrobiales bacterium]
MRSNKVKELWKAGETVRATWCTTGDPLTAEVLGNAGFDAVLLDMQHGFGIDPRTAGKCFQAISATPAIPLSRVPWNDPVHIQFALDAGSYGVIVPLVNTAEDAARAAGATRYPPVGFRSNGPNRVSLYAGADYVERANDEIICLVMIETLEALDNIEAIAATPGIDGFFIGPGDLAMSMGLPAGIGSKSPEWEANVLKVRDVAKAHGLVCGIAPFGAADARRRTDMGFQFCPMGSDWGYLAQGAKAALETFGE